MSPAATCDSNEALDEQVRPPNWREDVSSTARILAHGWRTFNLLIISVALYIGNKVTWPKGAPMFSRSALSTRILLLVLTVVALATLAKSQTPSSAVSYYEHGFKRYQKGDLNGAIADFTNAIEISSRLEGSKPNLNDISRTTDDSGHVTVIDPFTAKAYTSRALARFGQKDYDGAMADLNRAIRIHPGLAEAYLDRGAVRFAQGDREGAVADWDRALQVNPNLAEAYSNRGAVRHDLGDLDGGFADLNKAIELDPRETFAYCHRGFAWLAKRDFARAISDFDKAIKLNAKVATAFQGRGAAHLCLGRMDAAVADLTRAIQLDPKLAIAYMNRGLALTMQHKDAEANEDFAQAFKLNPGLKAEIDSRAKSAQGLRLKE